VLAIATASAVAGGDSNGGDSGGGGSNRGGKSDSAIATDFE